MIGWKAFCKNRDVMTGGPYQYALNRNQYIILVVKYYLEMLKLTKSLEKKDIDGVISMVRQMELPLPLALDHCATKVSLKYGRYF